MKRKILLLFLILLCFILGIRAQVPYGLNSYIAPNTGTIFLDFDGHTTTDIFWTSLIDTNAIACGPTTNMTTEQMVRVFNIVAEDFRPFTINVTTDSSVFLATPLTKRTRVVITPTSQWYPYAGGVAFIGSWGWGPFYGDVPCFVFPDRFFGDDKDAGEVVSHEVGHTLGLSHQSRYAYVNTDTCKFVTEYNSGAGTLRTETGWAPIMGVGYQRNLTLWHDGRTLTCNTFQSDIDTIIRSVNFVKLRPDDVGNNSSTAKLIMDAAYNIGGLINATNDVDYYRFDYNKTGRFTVNAKPYSPGPKIYFSTNEPKDNMPNQNANIDLKLQLYRNDVLIGEYNPLTKLDAVIDTALNPGIYYLAVSNTENPNIYNYGMVGSYSISGIYDGQTALDFQPTEWITNPTDQIKRITVNGDMNTGVYYLNLPNRDNFREISVFSITGSKLKSITNLQRVNMIDISGYSPGVYIVNVDGIKSFKIIKQ